MPLGIAACVEFQNYVSAPLTNHELMMINYDELIPNSDQWVFKALTLQQYLLLYCYPLVIYVCY